MFTFKDLLNDSAPMSPILFSVNKFTKKLFVSHFVVKPWIEYVNHSDRVQKGLCLSLMIHTVEGLKNDRFCSLSIVFERNHSRANGYHLDILFIVAYGSNSHKKVSYLTLMLRTMIQSLYHRWNSLLLCWKKNFCSFHFCVAFPKTIQIEFCKYCILHQNLVKWCCTSRGYHVVYTFIE